MRGVGQVHAIESVTLTHAEGNEGKKITVERRNRGFVGSKLLKKQGAGWSFPFQNTGIEGVGNKPEP